MTYKDVLIEKGFKYIESKDEWVLQLGFGMKVKCVKIFVSLFEVTKGRKIVFSHFVDSLEEFKEIINKATE